jgi:hypothetical protein
MSASENGSRPSIAPVTELGRVLRELLRREADIDRRELAAGDQQNTNAELWRQTNLQAIDGIELAIASIPATELAEAAVQLLIAGGYADQVAEEIDDARLRDPMTRLVRLLTSALPVVAEAAGVDLAAYAPGRYAHGERDMPCATDADEMPADRPASAEPQGRQVTVGAPTPRYRPSPLRLVEPQLEDAEAAAGREDPREEADAPPRGTQNEIVTPILDLIFAEAGCLTKRRLEQD